MAPIIRRTALWRLLSVAVLALALPAAGGAREAAAATPGESVQHRAPVEVDGRALFLLRGTSSYPAEERAARVAERIVAAARGATVAPADVRTAEVELGTAIFAGEERLLVVLDADAALEELSRRVLAESYVETIRTAIERYRAERTPAAFSRSLRATGVATLIFAVATIVLLLVVRRIYPALERRYKERVRTVGIQSFELVRAERIWNTLRMLLRATRVFGIALLLFLFLRYVLALFPDTRFAAVRLEEWTLGPLQTLWHGLLGQLPKLAFLVIFFFVTRAIVRLVRSFFQLVETGEVELHGFDRDWAPPTYKLLRTAIVVFALIVAYPYIPGSESEAFKGISIFLGVVFSLGSSSAISNVIAGYTMTYRRAFRQGDRVKIGDVVGAVTDIRLQVTHLRTPKNEEVVIPNSTILGTEVVNYSTLAKTEGLILHTTVGIGYETPWRQVEAMLLLAAERTEGLLAEPKPFVLQKALGDFAVTYEINVYSDRPDRIPHTYTELHRQILDVFNEFGIQIMTPAYEGDPEIPKVVPKEQWFTAPAPPPASGGG